MMTIPDFWQSLEVSLKAEHHLQDNDAQQIVNQLKNQFGNTSIKLVQEATKAIFLQPGWTIEGNVIQIVINAIQEKIEELKSIPQNLPRSGVVKFVGREQELETLHQHLQQSERVAISAIAGMGGIGKTELALQYGLLHWGTETYPGGVCWLRARDEAVIIQLLNYARVYLNLNPPEEFDPAEKVAYCWRNWPIPPNPPHAKADVLLIFDDVTDYDTIANLLPPNDPRFKVLVTTRNKSLGASFQQLDLTVLDEDAALALLASFIGETRLQQEPEPAQHLCEVLGYLPLGLELVARYLQKKPNLSLVKMLEQLSLEHKALQKQDRKGKETEKDMTAKQGVEAALNLTWKELDEEEREIACLLGLFALAPIPWPLVEQSLTAIDPDELEDIRDEVLVQLSLLQDEGNNTYQLHPLVRQFLQGQLQQRDTADDLKRGVTQALVAVAKTIPQDPTRDQITRVTPAIPHLEEVAEQLTLWLADEALIWPFTGLGRFYQGQGLYSQAEPWLKQCCSLLKTRLGQQHPDVATSLNNLALLYGLQGRYSEAEPLYLEALQMWKALLGNQHPDVAASLNNLAALYDSQGRYSEAELLYLEALQMRKALLGEQHPDVAASLNNLAELYRSQGRYSEAEPLYLEALQMCKALLGEQHPNVATSLNNLAGLYDSQGRYSEAEPLYLEALQMRKALLGEQHPHIAQSLNSLAALYRSQGRYSEAEPLFLEALQMRKALLGEQHPDVATSLNSLAGLYNSQGRYSEAEPLFLEALQMRKALLGDQHPDIAKSLNNLAELYRLTRRYSEAEPLYLEALQMWKALLGEQHPDVAASLNNLALLYDSQGRYSEAETLYLKALQILKVLLGEQGQHLNIAESLNSLALLYRSTGRYSEAEPLFLEALQMRKALLGDQHRNVATSLNNLAEFYRLTRRYSEAEPLYLEALQMKKALLGDQHPDVATSLNNLAELYRLTRRYSEAEPLYLEALQMFLQQLGQDHPNSKTVRQNYQRFLQQVVKENRQSELSSETSLQIISQL